MATEQFNVGEVVKLKSGGAEMIISAFSPNKKFAICKWHDKNHSLQEDNYPLESLKKTKS